MLNAPGTDSEALELLLLDLLAEGDSPAEAAATLVDRDVACGSYAEGSRELETAFEQYRDQAERVLARAQRTAEGLFRVNTAGGRQRSRDFASCDHENSPPGRGWLRPARSWLRRSRWRRMR